MVKKSPQAADRDLLAFIAAVPAAVFLWMVTAFVSLSAYDGIRAAIRDIPTVLIGGAVVGTWVALAAIVVLAGPIYAILAYADRITPTTVLASGTATGIGTSVAMRIFLADGVSMLTPVMGAVIGVSTAAIWWLIRGSSTPRLEDR